MEFAASVIAMDHEPRNKHRVIFETFDSLEPGKIMEFVNDHDPKPLQYQFMLEREGSFTWDFLDEGPDIWRVAITKLK